jgi:hypothetical protein
MEDTNTKETAEEIEKKLVELREKHRVARDRLIPLQSEVDMLHLEIIKHGRQLRDLKKQTFRTNVISTFPKVPEHLWDFSITNRAYLKRKGKNSFLAIWVEDNQYHINDEWVTGLGSSTIKGALLNYQENLRARTAEADR